MNGIIEQCGSIVYVNHISDGKLALIFIVGITIGIFFSYLYYKIQIEEKVR